MNLRRRLTELVLALAALAVTVGLALHVLPTTGSGKATGQARRIIYRGMLDSAQTSNNCTRGRIALTFDDGPDVYTPQILEVLKAYGVRATFFVMGRKAAAHPELIRAELAAGHIVENHSWDHPHLADLGQNGILQQLVRTQAAITAAGAPRPRLFRPPYGSLNARVEAVAHALKLQIVLWSLDTNDWRGRNANEIAASVIDQAVPGAVVLMHDGVPNSAATVQALPVIIQGLRSRGFCTALDTAP